MRQRDKQQHGKKKPKLQPKRKVKYRNLKSNYSRFEDDDFQINQKSRRKQRADDYLDEDDFYTSDNTSNNSSKRNRHRIKTDDYEYDDTYGDDYDY